MSYILYAVEQEKLGRVRHPEKLVLVEVWSELPPCNFTTVKARGGDLGRAAEDCGTYVWVPPSTAEVLEKRPILMAIGRRGKRFVNFFWVDAMPEGTPLETVVFRAKAFNEKELAGAPVKRQRVQ